MRDLGAGDLPIPQANDKERHRSPLVIPSEAEGSAVVPVSTALELFKAEHPKRMLTFEQR